MYKILNSKNQVSFLRYETISEVFSDNVHSINLIVMQSPLKSPAVNSNEIKKEQPHYIFYNKNKLINGPNGYHGKNILNKNVSSMKENNTYDFSTYDFHYIISDKNNNIKGPKGYHGKKVVNKYIKKDSNKKDDKKDITKDSTTKLNMLNIANLFKKQIGDKWNSKTLIQKDVNVKESPFPLEYVSFSPSLENIAKYVYETMLPVLNKELKGKLIAVEIETTNGVAIYCEEKLDNKK